MLCQGRDSEPPPIGERLVIEVEESSYGVSLALLKSSPGGVVGRVKKEEANTLLPFFLEPAFVVNDWLGRNLMVFTSFLFFNTFVQKCKCCVPFVKYSMQCCRQ